MKTVNFAEPWFQLQNNPLVRGTDPDPSIGKQK
jgi:hypothetical protein